MRSGGPLPIELGFETLEPLGELAVDGCPWSCFAPVLRVIIAHSEIRTTTEREEDLGVAPKAGAP